MAVPAASLHTKFHRLELSVFKRKCSISGRRTAILPRLCVSFGGRAGIIVIEYFFTCCRVTARRKGKREDSYANVPHNFPPNMSVRKIVSSTADGSKTRAFRVRGQREIFLHNRRARGFAANLGAYNLALHHQAIMGGKCVKDSYSARRIRGICSFLDRFHQFDARAGSRPTGRLLAGERLRWQVQVPCSGSGISDVTSLHRSLGAYKSRANGSHQAGESESRCRTRRCALSCRSSRKDL